jgi:hypothetical protein
MLGFKRVLGSQIDICFAVKCCKPPFKHRSGDYHCWHLVLKKSIYKIYNLVSGSIFLCLDLYFRWLNLHFVCLDLYLECLDLYLGCLDLQVGCLNLHVDFRTCTCVCVLGLVLPALIVPELIVHCTSHHYSTISQCQPTCLDLPRIV